MNKKFLPLILVGIIVLGVVIFIIFKNISPQSEIILFYGENCPFCQKVEDFIKENKIEEKVTFERKEVFNNEKNAQELVGKAQICELSAADIGVPLLWDGSKCFVGDTDIINFFKQKTGSL